MSEILLEKLLLSDFKFGFELEAMRHVGDFEMDDSDEDNDFYDQRDRYHDDQRIDTQYDLQQLFLQNLPKEHKKNIKFNEIQTDGSIEVDSDNEEVPFEWASPVMPFNPLYLQNMVNFLSRLRNLDITTNESCGFHTHLSFKTAHEYDLVWIYCQMGYALYTNMKEAESLIKMVDEFGNTIFLEGKQYASIDELVRLGERIAVTSDRNFENLDAELLGILSEDKFRWLRLHPQGTLEWRGPRDFLNDGSEKTIKLFMAKLIDFVKLVIKYQDNKEFNGIKGLAKDKFINYLKDVKDKSNHNTQGTMELMTGYFSNVDTDSTLMKNPKEVIGKMITNPKLEIQILEKLTDKELEYVLSYVKDPQTEQFLKNIEETPQLKRVFNLISSPNQKMGTKRNFISVFEQKYPQLINKDKMLVELLGNDSSGYRKSTIIQFFNIQGIPLHFDVLRQLFTNDLKGLNFSSMYTILKVLDRGGLYNADILFKLVVIMFKIEIRYTADWNKFSLNYGENLSFIYNIVKQQPLNIQQQFSHSIIAEVLNSKKYILLQTVTILSDKDYITLLANGVKLTDLAKYIDTDVLDTISQQTHYYVNRLLGELNG